MPNRTPSCAPCRNRSCHPPISTWCYKVLQSRGALLGCPGSSSMRRLRTGQAARDVAAYHSYRLSPRCLPRKHMPHAAAPRAPQH